MPKNMKKVLMCNAVLKRITKLREELIQIMDNATLIEEENGREHYEVATFVFTVDDFYECKFNLRKLDRTHLLSLTRKKCLSYIQIAGLQDQLDKQYDTYYEHLQDAYKGF